MTAVTISRQLGSMGCEIAYRAAKLLDYQVVWRELINQAAIQAGTPEIALATIDEFGLLDLETTPQDYSAYLNSVQRTLEKLALSGNVIIVGRAGQVILRDWQDVFHVRVVAPINERIKRIAQQQNISLDCASAQVETSDSYRYDYLHRFYDVNWNDQELYHVIINTGKISIDDSASFIQCIVNSHQNIES